MGSQYYDDSERGDNVVVPENGDIKDYNEKDNTAPAYIDPFGDEGNAEVKYKSMKWW